MNKHTRNEWKNLEKHTRDEWRTQIFDRIGRVLEIRVARERESGRSRGFAFVDFEDDYCGENSFTPSL